MIFAIIFMIGIAIAGFTGFVSLGSLVGASLFIPMLYIYYSWFGATVPINELIPAAVLVLLTAMTAYTWNGWPSLLPFISVAVTSIGYWTDNAQKIRLSQLIGSPCTLLYDIFIRTWGGAISESMTIVSIIVSIARFGWNNLDDKKSA